MSNIWVSPTQRQYPLLYWTTMAYIVGVPNFVHFDSTGRKVNPINLSSISLVIQVAVRYDSGLWIALLLVLVLATVFAPASRLTPPTTMDLLLSFFRLAQWVIAFVLIVALYSRTPPMQATKLVVELIGRSSWIWVAMVWIFLPIMPAQVYGIADEGGPDTVRRLGGQLLHPGDVALLAGLAFFYALFFFSRGPRKWTACLLALITLFLTGARTQQAGFLLALLLYAIVLSRNSAMRWGMIGATALALVMGISLSGRMMKYVSRGENAQTLSTLDGKTPVWEASLEAIAVRPFLGYGYSVGPRNAIRDHWRAAHWLPPHAHNEFIQAMLDGGAVALVFVLSIYGHVFATSIRQLGRGPWQLFLFIVFLQLGVTALTGVELTYAYRGVGGVLVLCFVGVLSGAAEKVREYRVVRCTTGSGSNSSLQRTAI